jgi:hypothetical protein
MSGQGDRTTTHGTDDSSVATALVRDLSVLVIKAIAPDETQLAGGAADDRAFSDVRRSRVASARGDP